MSTIILQTLEAKIPTLPNVLNEILNDLENPATVDTQALITKINSCGNLSDIIVNLLNSGYFKTKKKVQNVHEGFILIGVESMRNVVLGILLRSLLAEEQFVENFDRQLFFKHCIGTAYASEMLLKHSNLVNHPNPYKLFTYGFTHDIGVLALDYCMPFTISRVHAFAKEKKIPLLRAETKILGEYVHTTVGAWLCQKWNIPLDIANIIRYHHSPRQAAVDKKELFLVSIGDTISMNYYERMLDSNHQYRIDTYIMESVGLSMQQIMEVQDRLPSKVDKAIKFLNVETLDLPISDNNS